MDDTKLIERCPVCKGKKLNTFRLRPEGQNRITTEMDIVCEACDGSGVHPAVSKNEALQAEVADYSSQASHWNIEYELALAKAEALQAKVERLAAIVREASVSDMVGKCGWRTWEQARDGMSQALGAGEAQHVE